MVFSLGAVFHWSMHFPKVELLQAQKQNESVMGNIKTKKAGEVQMQEDQKAIEAVYHAMYRYEITKDVDNLANILSDRYVLVHMTGLEQSKEEYLTCVRNGQLHYFSEETDHLSIEVQGDTAVLTGQSRVNAAVLVAAAEPGHCSLLFQWKKRWDVVDVQGTSIYLLKSFSYFCLLHFYGNSFVYLLFRFLIDVAMS